MAGIVQLRGDDRTDFWCGHSSRLRRVVAICALIVFAGCGPQGDIVDPQPAVGWKPILSAAQVAIVRQTFPEFQPELYQPGTDPLNRAALRPDNFAPARFFGPPRPQAFKLTPGGVRLETNGYDLPDIPLALPSTGTYFHPDLTSYTISLGPALHSPLDELQSRMRASRTHNGPIIVWDRRNGRLNPAEVDTVLTAVRESVALEFPEAAQLPISTCAVTIEPTIFFVRGSNRGDTWAGGLTENKNQLHVMYFYIDGNGLIQDWHNFLVSEGLNCFLNAAAHEEFVD